MGRQCSPVPTLPCITLTGRTGALLALPTDSVLMKVTQPARRGVARAGKLLHHKYPWSIFCISSPSTKQPDTIPRVVLCGVSQGEPPNIPVQGMPWNAAGRACWGTVLPRLQDTPLACRIPHLNTEIWTAVPENEHLKRLWELQAKSPSLAFCSHFKAAPLFQHYWSFSRAAM